MAAEVPYYRRWIAQVAHQLWAYLWLQFVAVIAGLAILLLEIVFRGEPETAFGPAVRATLWVYGSLAVLYFAYLVFHAPVVLERERATRIGNLEDELKTLKAARRSKDIFGRTNREAPAADCGRQDVVRSQYQRERPSYEGGIGQLDCEARRLAR